MRFLSALIFFFSVAAHAADSRPLYTIFAGPAKGTYRQVADDMAKACPAFNIQVQTTEGTLANINSLIKPPPYISGNRIAFVQEDALSMVIGDVGKSSHIYKVISPMYSEEIMVIVNKKAGILNVRDLAGKRVSIGTPGSGNWFTASLIKKKLGIKWYASENSPPDAMLQVLTGQLDAAIIVGGVPLEQFQELGKTMSDRVGIIPVNVSALDKTYKMKRIPAKTYLWADYPVETKSTLSMMIAAHDVSDNAIKEFKSCLVKNLPAIQKFGHPKWQEISPLIRQK